MTPAREGPTRRVATPCTAATGPGMNNRRMELVEEMRFDEGVVDVELMNRVGPR